MNFIKKKIRNYLIKKYIHPDSQNLMLLEREKSDIQKILQRMILNRQPLSHLTDILPNGKKMNVLDRFLYKTFIINSSNVGVNYDNIEMYTNSQGDIIAKERKVDDQKIVEKN